MLDHEERFLFREEILNLANALAEPGAVDGPPDPTGIRRTKTGWRKVRPAEDPG